MIYKIQTEFGEIQINTDSEADAKRIAAITAEHRRIRAKYRDVATNPNPYEAFYHKIDEILTPPPNYEI
jgi:hypothetical protein